MNRRIEGIAQCVILAAFFALGVAAVVASVATGKWWMLLIGVASLVFSRMYYKEIERDVRNKRLQEKGRSNFED